MTLSSILKETVLPYNDLCVVEGSGLIKRLRATARLWYPATARLGVTVFMFCFLSFVIPLFLGGYQWATLEVALYEKIKIKGDWSEGMAIAAFQIFILFFISFSLTRLKDFKNYELLGKGKVQWLALPSLLLLPFFLFLLAPLIGLFLPLTQIVASDMSLFLIQDANIRSSMNSIIVALGSGGIFVLVFQLLLVYSLPRWVMRLFTHLASAPMIFIGFALFFIGSPSYLSGLVKIFWGYFLVFFPVTLRLYLNSALSELEPFKDISKLYGISRFHYWRRVVFPLQGSKSFLYGGVIAFWTVGEFSLPSFLFLKNQVLAQKVYEFYGNYRFHEAGLLNLFLLFIGLVIFSLFLGASYAIDKKFRTSPKKLLA